MMTNLIGQINIIKTMNIKPNFSALAREYGLDRRTVKKYYEGYEGKPKVRNKGSKLDKYYDEIKAKLSIKGVTVKGVYEYFIDKKYDIKLKLLLMILDLKYSYVNQDTLTLKAK